MFKRSAVPVLILLVCGLMAAHGTGTGVAEKQAVFAVEELGPGRFLIGSPAVTEAEAGGNNATPSAEAEQSPLPEPTPRRIELIAATAVAEGETETEWLITLQNEANTLSEGNLLIDLHPAATLGAETTLIQRAQQGEIDLVAMPIGALEKTVPELSVLITPLLFSGVADEKVLSVLNTENAATQALQKAFNAKGLTLLAILPGDRTETAVWGGVNGSFQKAKGLRVAISNSAPSRSYWLGLGAEPKRFKPEELQKAVADGTVDALEGTPEALLSAGASGEGFTLVMTDHGLELTVLFIGTATYEMLPESFRSQLNAAVARSLTEEHTLISERGEQKLSKLLETGIQTYEGTVPQAGAFEGTAEMIRNLLQG